MAAAADRRAERGLAMAGHPRRAGPRIPQGKLVEIGARGVGHGAEEVVAGGSAAVVAAQVEGEAPSESGPAKEGLEHADHLRNEATK